MVGWTLVAAVVVASLVPAKALEALELNDKIEHVAAYLALTVWFAGLYRRRCYLTIALSLIALGVVLDLLQGLTATRSLDWHDMLANALGVAVGMGLSLAGVGGWCQYLERRLLT